MPKGPLQTNERIYDIFYEHDDDLLSTGEGLGIIFY